MWESPMEKVSSLVSANLGDALSNIKNWGGLFYNAADYGIKPGKDVTQKLQALVDKANAEGRTTIVFLPGDYFVTQINNDANIVYFGDGAKFIGGYGLVINSFKDFLSIDSRLSSVVINVKYPPAPLVGAVGGGQIDDTLAIQNIINYAISIKGTVFFPYDTYKITSQINVNGDGFFSIVGAGGLTGQAVINAYIDNGSVFNVECDWQVKISNIEINRMSGNGSSILFSKGAGHELSECIIRGYSGNSSELVQFVSGTTIVKNNKFVPANPDSYAIICRAIATQLNINSYIINNSFAGAGKGILVDAANDSIRVEGLKVHKNVFVNTGSEHLTIKTILHIDISNNMFDQSSFICVWALPAGLGINGLYIIENYISPAQAPDEGIAVKLENDNNFGIANVNISNNMIIYAGYGINGGANISNITVNGNILSDINHDSISLHGCRNVVITDNQMPDTDNFSLTASDGENGGPFVISNNIIRGSVLINKSNPSLFTIKDNGGYVTNRFSSATFDASTSGDKYVSVPHGLSGTPDIKKCIAGVSQASGGFTAQNIKVVSVDETNVICFCFVSTPGNGAVGNMSVYAEL